MSRTTIWYLQPPSASARRNSYHLQIQCLPARISGRQASEDFGLCTSPTVLGRKVQPANARLTTPFGKICARTEEGDGAICGLLQWCSPGGCCTLGQIPTRTNPGNCSQEDPAGPLKELAEELASTEVPTEEAAPAEEPTEEMAPTEEPPEEAAPTEASAKEADPTKVTTKEADPTEVTTKEVAPMEEPTEELTAPTATASMPAGKPNIPPVQHEEKGKGEFPHSGFPGWTEVLHPTQSATSARQTPLTPGELR